MEMRAMSDETTTEQLAEIEGQATEYIPPDGWRVLAVGERLRAGDMTVRKDGYCYSTERVGYYVGLNQRYIRRIGPEPQPEPEQVNDWPSVRELRHELKTVQTQLGESQRRVTQLEELVGSLRTINEATEKTVRAAGQQNTDLQHRLEVVSKEWADQAATCNGLQQQVEAVEADLVQQRLERIRYQNQVLRLTAELDNKTTECRNLRIELDALQQAPQAETVTTAPTSKDDRFEEGWDAGTARAVETIAEWLEPIRHLIDAADNMAETERASNLAADMIRALPAIMRSLTGLTPED